MESLTLKVDGRITGRAYKRGGLQAGFYGIYWLPVIPTPPPFIWLFRAKRKKKDCNSIALRKNEASNSLFNIFFVMQLKLKDKAVISNFNYSLHKVMPDLFLLFVSELLVVGKSFEHVQQFPRRLKSSV